MKIYLAGPDVFRKDAIAYGNYLKGLCREYGHEGLFPLDNEVPHGTRNPSKVIFDGDVQMIHDCDVVLANLVPFRGPSVDVGTAFEMGYGLALGKIVLGYNKPTQSYNRRVTAKMTAGEFTEIEDFGQFDNLMITHGARKSFESIEEALGYLNGLTRS